MARRVGRGRSRPGEPLRFRRTLITASVLREIRLLVYAKGRRTVLGTAARLCERFGWHRPAGAPATASCVGLLRRLERRGLLRLQPAWRRVCKSTRTIPPELEIHGACVGAFPRPVPQKAKELVVRPLLSHEHAACTALREVHYG